MAHRDTAVSALCHELGIRPVTLYRHVGPQGELREQGEKVLTLSSGARWTVMSLGRVATARLRFMRPGDSSSMSATA